MLESATVTLKYQEFKELVDKASKAEKLEKENLKLEEEIENRDERKSLDKIINILVDATHLAKTIKEKQKHITECIEIYCNTFDIPIEMITEDN
ncbi:hypothetical protein H1057_18205 [Clostridium sporogenes]|uniref:hypothetical protein n=1 Tax=Clostridium sporogenes TaxID=1509 RepID=UPI0015EFD32B|nr:hypothetical protein [Clostridium sporogenes]MBA4509953.1 hypothetical protein [Clostridium sporogenes]